MRSGMAFHWGTALFLFIYYGAAAVCGGAWWYQAVIVGAKEDPQSLALAVTAGVSAALAGSGLFYARKLYRDLFADTPDAVTSSFALLATTAYFIFRPFFSVMLAAVAVLSSFAFIHATTTTSSHIGEGFVIFSSLVGLFVAGATGAAVNRLERLGKDSIESIRPTS